MLSLVRTSPTVDHKHEGLSQFIVDLKGPGVQIRPIALISGKRHFAEVVLDDAFVPDDLVVGRVGDGWRQVTSELAYERSGPERFLSTFPLLDAVQKHVGELPDTRAAQAIGELVARLWSLRHLSMNIADGIQAHRDVDTDAALMKDLGTRFERDVIDVARQLVSLDGASGKFRHLYGEAVLAAPGFTLRGGTSEILRGIVVRSLALRGSSWPALRLDPDIARLLVETSDAVFSQDQPSIVAAIERAGLSNVAETGLAEAALAVRVSAFHSAEVPFAEQVLLPDPKDRTRGALMRSVQMVGAIAAVRDLAIKYAGDRHQFGQPLVRFQAVQQHLAELAAESAAADAAVAAAIVRPTLTRIAAAKVVAGRAAGIVARNAHQVHGAIGFTQEYPLYRLTTKLWRWRDEFGSDVEWAVELGRDLAGRNLWQTVTNE